MSVSIHNYIMNKTHPETFRNSDPTSLEKKCSAKMQGTYVGELCDSLWILMCALACFLLPCVNAGVTDNYALIYGSVTNTPRGAINPNFYTAVSCCSPCGAGGHPLVLYHF